MSMKPEIFKAWRKRMGFTRRAAAEALGLSIETIANYETGRRRGSEKPVQIPKTISLACGALAYGLKPYGDG